MSKFLILNFIMNSGLKKMCRLNEKFKKVRLFTKNGHSCPYYKRSKLTEKILGIAGFCKLQNREIFYKWTVGKIPYFICERSNSQYMCGVYKTLNEEQEI